MKYEEPKLELINLVAREVFMTASQPITNQGGSDNGNGWGQVPDPDEF